MDARLALQNDRHPVEALPAARQRLFSLSVLGPFELLNIATGTRVAVTARKSRALLAYLAIAPGGTASRSALAALLWGDAGDEQARQSLRQALSSLRRIEIGATGLLRSDDETVQLDTAGVEIDALDLLQLDDHVDIDHLLRVCAAYRGPFGADLEIEEPGFDDWLRAERQRFADRAVVLHDRLVRRLDEAGRHQEALVHANALLAINPIREETHRVIIALEAQLSGRAAAMQRFETFRLLLRDELAVRPEQATIKLIDRLRDPPAAEPQADTSASTMPAQPEDGSLSPVSLHRFDRRKLIAVGGAAVAAALLIVFAVLQRGPSDQRTAEDQRYGRALLALDAVATSPTQGSRSDLLVLEREASLAFSRNNRVSLIEFVDGAKRRPDYRIRARLVDGQSSPRADVDLVSTDSGNTVWSGSIPLASGSPSTFARELYGYVTSEIVLREARNRANSASVPAKLWRAKAAQIQTRLGTEDPTAMVLYQEILAEDPTNVNALLGLSETFILRVARNQSGQRAADIAAISDLLIRTKPLIPNSSDIAFKEGMLNKLQGNFQQASSNFEQSVRLDPAHWNAAAQYAHVMIFLGRLEEGFQLMQAATPNLLPDLGAAETAYVAGETALVAGHDAEAARYLGMAVSGNPTVGRIQALYAVALFRVGRFDEARSAVEKASQLSPNYTPEVMNQRGGRTADSRYIEAKLRMVDAFRAVRAAQ